MCKQRTVVKERSQREKQTLYGTPITFGRYDTATYSLTEPQSLVEQFMRISVDLCNDNGIK